MNIFFNPEEQRFRAGWRLVILIVLIVSFVLLLLVMGNLIGLNNDHFSSIIYLSIASTSAVWIATRFIDKRRFDSLGFNLDRRWYNEFGVGTGIGAGAMAIIFIVEYSTGWIEITGFGWERAWQMPYIVPFLGFLLLMIIVGFYEELVFRGYFIQNLTEGMSGNRFSPKQAVIAAVIISSAIFGFLHSANPNASLISTTYIILAGFILAYPYVITGSLGISVGIHFSWNFFQGGVFGFPVSGIPDRSSIIQIRELGPDLFTGGSFGPEAGFAGLLGFFVVLAVTHLYLKRRGTEIGIADTFLPSNEIDRKDM